MHSIQYTYVQVHVAANVHCCTVPLGCSFLIQEIQFSLCSRNTYCWRGRWGSGVLLYGHIMCICISFIQDFILGGFLGGNMCVKNLLNFLFKTLPKMSNLVLILEGGGGNSSYGGGIPVRGGGEIPLS